MSTKPGQRRRPQPRNRPATRIERQMVAGPLIQPARRHDPRVFAGKIALLGSRDGRLVPRMVLIHRIAQRIFLDKLLGVLPSVVIGASEQDADVQVDIHQVRRHQFVVDDHAGSDIHRAAPFGHLLVGVIANRGIVERAPTAQQHAPPAHLFVTGKRFIEEVKQVVVQGHDLLHELHVLHQPHEVIGEELNRRDRSHPAG